MLRICSRFILILALSALPVAAGSDLRGAARIIDGDTLDVGGARVRLFGIDAPELSQTCETPHGDWACGRWARDVLRALADGPVTCIGRGNDRYGRVIARCDAGQGDLGAALVEAGAATAYRRYSTDYVANEALAQAGNRGIWRQNGRGVVDPAEFRAARRAASAADSPVATSSASNAAGDAIGNCAIKGNISANGRIFHVPGQRDYDRTRINPSRGERWFCSAEEALAAGWRAAAR